MAGDPKKKKKSKVPKTDGADTKKAVVDKTPEGDADEEGVRHASRKWRKAELHAQEDWKRKDMERRNSTKYHYLKFIEKQKVERQLKVCRKKLLEAVQAGDEALETELKLELKRHIANHEYIDHYPRHLPYNALFPAEDSEKSVGRRNEIRAMIREALGSSATVVDDEEAPRKVKEAAPKVTPKAPKAAEEGEPLKNRRIRKEGGLQGGLTRNERRRRALAAKAGLTPAPEAPPESEPGLQEKIQSLQDKIQGLPEKGKKRRRIEGAKGDEQADPSKEDAPARKKTKKASKAKVDGNDDG